MKRIALVSRESVCKRQNDGRETNLAQRIYCLLQELDFYPAEIRGDLNFAHLLLNLDVEVVFKLRGLLVIGIAVIVLLKKLIYLLWIHIMAAEGKFT